MANTTTAGHHVPVRIQASFPVLPLNAEQLAKRSVQRRVLFGWAIVCTVDGVDNYDTYNTHIPDEEMLAAAFDYFTNRRRGHHNHVGPLVGTVDYSLPLTREVASIYGLQSRRTGWLIGWRPLESRTIDQFDRGEIRGFSINGWADVWEPYSQGHVLRKLRVDEISVVDDPGQALATVDLVGDIDAVFSRLGIPVLE